MHRYFIEVSYRGTRYAGFQVQENAVTIQSELEKALAIKFRQPFSLTGASRTDAGVHALQNFFHFDRDQPLWDPSGDNILNKQTRGLRYSLNSLLPWDIVLKDLFEVPAEAHCRFDAVSRQYRYYIYASKDPFLKDRAYFFPYPVEMESLQAAAALIRQTVDFTSFSKRNTQVGNFRCTLMESEWIQEANLLVYQVKGNRFLRGMVRGLVGTMLKVGTGKITLEDLQGIIESRDCRNADFSVPAHGLFLQKVAYPEGLTPGTGSSTAGRLA
ncbi:MAG: tRNA pseudouridine(38-40) synthase TruA [Bacteroidota bacterium]|nr:tRNA pseudouridine(38-40) synthase TruA [Bacteroidota bacterium]